VHQVDECACEVGSRDGRCSFFSDLIGDSLRALCPKFRLELSVTEAPAPLAYAAAACREVCATYAALVRVIIGVVFTTRGEPSFHLFCTNVFDVVPSLLSHARPRGAQEHDALVPSVGVAFLGRVEPLQEGDVAVLPLRRSRDVISTSVSLCSIDLFHGRGEVRRVVVDADKEILCLLCEGLGLRPDFLEEDISSGDVVLHVNHYLPCSDLNTTLGLPPHCDRPMEVSQGADTGRTIPRPSLLVKLDITRATICKARAIIQSSFWSVIDCGWDTVSQRQPRPPDVQFKILSGGVQVRPTPWPSFYVTNQRFEGSAEQFISSVDDQEPSELWRRSTDFPAMLDVLLTESRVDAG
jgi:hypothetical protein